ncbi:hypothetical protein ATCC90586_010171 [Pythium insidiosum]|nr:hypothetical protein ATCC90586_010171 [Pythium insidiosum]
MSTAITTTEAINHNGNKMNNISSIIINNNGSPNDRRCRYPSKRCENPRAVKRDGELHRFCEYHRVKANLNQQRLEQRRRIAKQVGDIEGFPVMQSHTMPRHFTPAETQLLYAVATTDMMPSYVIDPTLAVSDVALASLRHLTGGDDERVVDSLDLSDVDIELLSQMLEVDENSIDCDKQCSDCSLHSYNGVPYNTHVVFTAEDAAAVTPEDIVRFFNMKAYKTDGRRRCMLYPSKRCENLRAVKRDGELHRFCDFHRAKANLNQQRLEHRRRIAKHQASHGAPGFQTMMPTFMPMGPHFMYTTGISPYVIDPTLQSIDMVIDGLEFPMAHEAGLSDMDIEHLLETVAEDSMNSDLVAVPMDLFDPLGPSMDFDFMARTKQRKKKRQSAKDETQQLEEEAMAEWLSRGLDIADFTMDKMLALWVEEDGDSDDEEDKLSAKQELLQSLSVLGPLVEQAKERLQELKETVKDEYQETESKVMMLREKLEQIEEVKTNLALDRRILQERKEQILNEIKQVNAEHSELGRELAAQIDQDIQRRQGRPRALREMIAPDLVKDQDTSDRDKSQKIVQSRIDFLARKYAEVEPFFIRAKHSLADYCSFKSADPTFGGELTSSAYGMESLIMGLRFEWREGKTKLHVMHKTKLEQLEQERAFKIKEIGVLKRKRRRLNHMQLRRAELGKLLFGGSQRRLIKVMFQRWVQLWSQRVMVRASFEVKHGLLMQQQRLKLDHQKEAEKQYENMTTKLSILHVQQKRRLQCRLCKKDYTEEQNNRYACSYHPALD